MSAETLRRSREAFRRMNDLVAQGDTQEYRDACDEWLEASRAHLDAEPDLEVDVQFLECPQAPNDPNSEVADYLHELTPWRETAVCRYCLKTGDEIRAEHEKQ